MQGHRTCVSICSYIPKRREKIYYIRRPTADYQTQVAMAIATLTGSSHWCRRLLLSEKTRTIYPQPPPLLPVLLEPVRAFSVLLNVGQDKQDPETRLDLT